MPTYEYLCKACGVLSQIYHSICDSPKRKCPKCGALKLKRQISSGGGVIFRGVPGQSGFHALDYRKANESDNTDE